METGALNKIEDEFADLRRFNPKHPALPENEPTKRHVAMDEGRWKVFFHRDRRSVVWSNPIDFADACRYMKLTYHEPYGKNFTTAEEDI
jgi:hypothetical protein